MFFIVAFLSKKSNNFTNLEGNWSELSRKYSNKQIWKINKAFLDNQINANNKIIFSHDPYHTIPGSFFEREVNYLKKNGYTFEMIGDYYHAVR